ncbi:MAG: hypothetical protein WCJ01_09315 [Ignavibacteria bacterium]
MQINPGISNKIERRSFFYKLSKGFAGLLLLNIFPFRFITGKNKNASGESIKVTVNPLAVKYGTRKVKSDE